MKLPGFPMLYLPLWKLDGASLKSEDASGRLCTANGAFWTPSGRTFDGLDDYIVTDPIAIGSSMSWGVRVASDVAKNFHALDHRTVDGGVQPIWITNTGLIQFFDMGKGNSLEVPGAFQHDGRFHWIWCIGTASSRRIYYDCKAVASDSVGITPITARALYIGCRYTVNGNYLQGKVSHVILYNRPLTAMEIQELQTRL